jgi:hypothetical protein
MFGALSVPVVAFAARAPLDSGSLGSGSSVVTSCGTFAGFSTSSGYVGARYQLTAITIGNVPGPCQGQNFRLTMFNTANNASYGELTGTFPMSSSVAILVGPGVGPDLATVPSDVGIALVVTP